MTHATTRNLHHRALTAYGHYRQILNKTQSGQPLDELDLHILRESIRTVQSAMQSCLTILEEIEPKS
ncbi:MAG: hypothetical protein RLZZ458_1674 [Planctomycetota bacterium]|jgi:hypothetical protein